MEWRSKISVRRSGAMARDLVPSGVAGPVDVDVLVVGSGASGLTAAVSAERAGARVAVATKGSLQANNSSKAQGGIQAAFGVDESPEQHADDVSGAPPTRPPTNGSSRS